MTWTFDNSELTELIETTQDPESPFHDSNATHSTDTTIYPPVEQPQSNKKRKIEDDAIVADIQIAPSCVLANKHLVEKVYSVIKKEAEELGALAVRAIHDQSQTLFVLKKLFAG